MPWIRNGSGERIIESRRCIGEGDAVPFSVPKILRRIPLEIHEREYIGGMFRAGSLDLVGLTDLTFSGAAGSARRSRGHVSSAGRGAEAPGRSRAASAATASWTAPNPQALNDSAVPRSLSARLGGGILLRFSRCTACVASPSRLAGDHGQNIRG